MIKQQHTRTCEYICNARTKQAKETNRFYSWNVRNSQVYAKRYAMKMDWERVGCGMWTVSECKLEWDSNWVWDKILKTCEHSNKRNTHKHIHRHTHTHSRTNINADFVDVSVVFTDADAVVFVVVPFFGVVHVQDLQNVAEKTASNCG